jgi:PAS domain S-box-containing protein
MKSMIKRTERKEWLKIPGEKSRVGVYILQDGKFCHINPSFPIITGYSADELIGRDSLELVAPEDRKKVRENAIKMLKGKLLSPYYFRVICKDGSIKWLMATARSIQFQGRRATLGNYMEITVRKQAEEALKESEDRYTELADSITDVFFAMDEHLKYTYWNKASEILTGIRAEDALGNSLLEIFPDTPGVRKAEKVYRKVLRTQQSQTFVSDVDLGGRHYIFDISAYPSRDGVAVFARDITERKQAEEALQKSEEKYRLLSENASDIIWTTDMNLKFTYASPSVEKLLGYTPEEFTSLTVDKTLTSPSLELAMVAFQEELAVEQLEQKDLERTRTIESELICKDGSTVWLEVKMTFLRDEAGHPTGILGIARDIAERKKAEQALRQSEERYRTILEETGDGYFETDLAGNFTFVNDAQARLLGYSKEELIGATYRVFTPEEDVKAVFEAYHRMYETGEPLKDFPDKVIRKDGSLGFAETSAFPIRNDKGEIIGFRGVRRDITERKQAEEALRQSGQIIESVLESAPDGVYLMDLKGTFLYGNQKAEEIVGYSRDELIGKSFLDLGLLPEEQLEKAIELLECSNRGQPTGPDDLQLIKGTGSRVWTEINTSVILRGEETVVIGFVRDITKRKEMEEAIRCAAEEWRKTFDSISAAISIHSRDCRLRRVNKAFADIFHKEFRQLLDKHCYEIIHCTKGPVPGCPHQETLQTNKPARAEFFEPNLGIYLEVTTSPISDERGEITGIVHITRDITEQKQQNERLMLTDRLASIGELAAGAAHEINNPLTSIIGFSQLIMEKDIPDDIHQDLTFINSEAQRAAGVTKNLLAFAQKHKPVKRLNQINTIIEDVLKLRSYEHKIKDIEVNKQLASDLPESMVDYFQIQQVFFNLVINAEYFMTEAHDRGTLTITTEKQNGTVRISFADDGLGIPPENLSQIFNPFFTTKETGKGTGLGLSICHGVVSEHGGQIYARSQPGEGTTIFVELPINGR